MRSQKTAVLLIGMLGCGGTDAARSPDVPQADPPVGTTITARDTTIAATFEAAGLAEPFRRATLSTRMMGAVTAVLVQEGDRVTAGQVLARIDARELAAKRTQVQAGIAVAEAEHADAETQAARFRALYADSAATQHQLDQVETALTRAGAGLRAARASNAELDAMESYATVRAPFAGVITRRWVDPGAMAAPGAPLLDIEDAAQLRISVTAPPTIGGALHRGDRLAARVEGRVVEAIVEGTAPAAGAVQTVNAIVANPRGAILSGGAATLRLPDGSRTAILVPASALVHQGDLTGVRVHTASGPELRWVTLGPVGATDTLVEIASGVQAGDVILTVSP